MSEDTGTEVVNVFGGNLQVRDMQALAAKAKEAAQNNPRSGAPDGSEYMNFSGKTGILKIGKDDRVIEDDELWLVNVTSFEEGWVCWKGGKSPSSRLANIYTGVPVPQPDPDELGPFDTARGDGWYQAKAMVLKSIDNDQQGYWKINSISGVSAFADLIDEFADRASQGLPAWPVVRIGKESFESQGYKNFKPVFYVEGWLDNEQMMQVATDEIDVYQALGIDSEPEPEPEPKPAPRGRRRVKN